MMCWSEGRSAAPGGHKLVFPTGDVSRDSQHFLSFPWSTFHLNLSWMAEKQHTGGGVLKTSSSGVLKRSSSVEILTGITPIHGRMTSPVNMSSCQLSYPMINRPQGRPPPAAAPSNTSVRPPPSSLPPSGTPAAAPSNTSLRPPPSSHPPSGTPAAAPSNTSVRPLLLPPTLRHPCCSPSNTSVRPPPSSHPPSGTPAAAPSHPPPHPPSGTPHAPPPPTHPQSTPAAAPSNTSLSTPPSSHPPSGTKYPVAAKMAARIGDVGKRGRSGSLPVCTSTADNASTKSGSPSTAAKRKNRIAELKTSAMSMLPSLKTSSKTDQVSPLGTPIIGRRGHIFTISTPVTEDVVMRPQPQSQKAVPCEGDPFDQRRKMTSAPNTPRQDEEDDKEPVWQRRLSLLFVPPTENELDTEK
ncbi:hypothetical protein Hamer_G004042, partial [Homarus americanus]